MGMMSLNWIDIDRAAILRNVAKLGRLAGIKVMMAAAAKANGYGHGLAEMVTILRSSPVTYLALHSADEAETARHADWDRRIMLVGGVAPEEIEAVLRLDLEPTIFETSLLERLGRLCRRSKVPVRVHIKREPGTHRQGLTQKELDRAVVALRKYPEITVAGVSTHFANIEDTTDHS